MGTPIENNTNKINSFNQKLDNFFSSQGAAAPEKPLGSTMLIQNAYHIQQPIDFNNIIVCFLDDFLGYSENGTDWIIANDTDLGYGEKYIAVSADNSMILAGSYSCSTLFISIDGKTWRSTLSLPSGVYPTQIYFINGDFYVLRTDGYYSYSPDGYGWKHYDLITFSGYTTDPLSLMQYNPILRKYLFISSNNMYVVTNPTNEYMIEVTWVDWDVIYSEYVYNITCFKGVWIASCSWSLMWSSDGVTWNRYENVDYWEDMGNASFYQTDDVLFINDYNMTAKSYYTLDGLTLYTPNAETGHDGRFYLTSIRPDDKVIFYDGNNFFGWGYHDYYHLDEYISHHGLFISSDLINWALVEDDYSFDMSYMYYNYDNGMFLQFNNDTYYIYFSNDGERWVQSNLARNDIWDSCFLYRFNQIIISFADATYISYQPDN